MLETVRRAGAAVLVGIFLAGCDGSAGPAGTATFHVQDMGKRLKLL